MYDFIVLTTAITRPDLHGHVFAKNLDFFDACNIKWLINIDSINNQFSINDTIENFKKIFAQKNNIDVEFLVNEVNPCFFSATQNLVLTAHKRLEACKIGVIWLEDDWVITSQTFSLQLLNRVRISRTSNVLFCPGSLKQKQLFIQTENYPEDKLWFISLAPRSRVSFNPGIWSKEMFMQGLYKKLANLPKDQIDDPETLCADPFNTNQDLNKIKFMIDPVFQDAGRRWSAQARLEKWDKKQSVELEQRNFTYNKHTPTSLLNNHRTDKLVGFFVLSIPFLGFSIKWLTETKYSGEGWIDARLLAIPFITLELKVTEVYETEVYINKIHAWARAQPFDKLAVKAVWHFMPNSEELHSVELTFRDKKFIAKYSKEFPLHWIWLHPIQWFIGIVVYVITLVKMTNKLTK